MRQTKQEKQAVCLNCGQWQRGGDCLNEYVKRGLAPKRRSMNKQAYLFVSNVLLGGMHPVPPDDAWMEHRFGMYVCRRPWHALQYGTGETLCLVEIENIEQDTGKLIIARRSRIIKRVDLTDDLWAFARAAARDVLHLWDAPDVVRQYLETGNEALRAEANTTARDVVWTASVADRPAVTWGAAGAAMHATAKPTVHRPVTSWKENTPEGAAWGAASNAAWASTMARRRFTSLYGAEEAYGARFDALCRRKLEEAAPNEVRTAIH